MLLSERYLELFNELDACLAKVPECDEAVQRSCYREQAWNLQEQCGAVAHCIAVFGDVPVHELTREHVKAAKGFRRSGKHPWLIGLHLVRPDLFEEVQAIPSPCSAQPQPL